MKLADGLYGYPWTGLANNANTYLIASDTLTLIDPGHRHLFGEVEREINADGFAVEDIELVVATHCHPDHIEAAYDVCQRADALFTWHEIEEQYARTVGKKLATMLGLQLPDLQASFLLTEGELLLGKSDVVTLEVVHTPGHSPGEICLYWPEHKALFSGDLVFVDGVGRTDFPGGDLDALIRSIQRVAELDVELLLPGHGPTLRGRQEILLNIARLVHMF